MYRKVNMKVLGQRKEVIGSCITTCKRLAANDGEVKAYFPNLIGLSPTHPDFVKKVKEYLSNIQVVINENNVTFDTSFVFEHKSDYLKFKKREDKINEEYEKVNRSDIKSLKEALKHKIEALNTLESEKYKYGHPVKIEDYIVYRHCLFYRDVAKDMSLINVDPYIRFYIKDEAKEAERMKKINTARVNAMRNFVEISASPTKFNNAYIQMCVHKGDNVANSLLKSKTVMQTELMNFANEQPEKFNKIVNDKTSATKALIETLIARGELVRSEYNQQITTPDGGIIGANLNEAVAYFDNPANKDVRNVYEAKLEVLQKY
jgi:hypothetical protein